MVEADRCVQISEDGLKTIVKDEIFLTTKFKGILWTSDPNVELPIKMPKGSTGPGTETPLTLSQALLA